MLRVYPGETDSTTGRSGGRIVDMRATIYRGMLALPFKVGGAAGTGLGIVAGLWPDRVKTMTGTALTAENIQLAGIALLAVGVAYFFLLWLLKPTAEHAPAATRTGHTATNFGDHGTTIANARDVHIHPPAPPPKPPAPKHETEKLNAGLGQAFAALNKSCPETPIWQAAAYVRQVIGDTDEGHCYPETLRKIRQAALEGRIEIWGRKEIPPTHYKSPQSCSDVWSPIPRSYWEDHMLNSMATGEIWDGHDHTWDGTGRRAGRYWSLRVHQDEVRAVWPMPLTRPAFEAAPDAYSEEWHYQAGKDRGDPPARDKPLSEALAYVVLGSWGKDYITDVILAGVAGHDLLEDFEQLAGDGKLRAWGKRPAGYIFELVPAEHWRDHRVDLLTLMKGNGTTVGNTPYAQLMVSRAEFESEWPHAR